MTFDLHKSIQILSRTPKILKTSLEDLDDEWIYENEGGKTWSPYEVVGHLIHGEKTDWIPRVKVILGSGEPQTFTPFDRFAHLENQAIPLDQLLTQFKTLRQFNLAYLEELNLNEEDFECLGLHPELGEVNLKQLLATWVVHDLGHLAQIFRVMAKQYTSEVGPWQAYLGVLHRK